MWHVSKAPVFSGKIADVFLGLALQVGLDVGLALGI